MLFYFQQRKACGCYKYFVVEQKHGCNCFVANRGLSVDFCFAFLSGNFTHILIFASLQAFIALTKCNIIKD